MSQIDSNGYNPFCDETLQLMTVNVASRDVWTEIRGKKTICVATPYFRKYDCVLF